MRNTQATLLRRLPHEELIANVCERCRSDERLDAALLYGPFASGKADAHSDVEFWRFFEPRWIVDHGLFMILVDDTRFAPAAVTLIALAPAFSVPAANPPPAAPPHAFLRSQR